MRWPQAGGHPFPIPRVPVASPRGLAERRDLNSHLRPRKDDPAFWGRSRRSAQQDAASGPRGGCGGRGSGCRRRCHGDEPRPAPQASREVALGLRGRAKYRRMGIQLLGIPVQRNQHYFSQSTFTYIISFTLSISQYGYPHFTGNKPKVSVTWPRSRRRLPGFPPLRTTFCNTICAPEAGYAPSIVVRNVFDPPILTPCVHENLMALEKV